MMIFQFFRFGHAVLGRFLGRVMAIALCSFLLWVGGIWVEEASVFSQGAIAATPSEADAYDVGPIRQTRNPISNENFNGGVDRTELEQKDRSRQYSSEEDTEGGKGVIDTLKDLLPGNSSDSTSGSTSRPSPQSDFKPERNPTLDRYRVSE